MVATAAASTKKRKEEKAKEVEGTQTQAYEAAPEGDGWEEVGAPDFVAWYQPEPGVAVIGQVVGRMRLKASSEKEKDRHIILIRVTKPTQGLNSDDTSEVIDVEVGQVIAMGLRQRTKELILCVKNKCMVYVRANARKKIKGGRSLWEFEVKSKGVKAKPDAIGDGLDAILESIDGPPPAADDSDLADLPF